MLIRHPNGKNYLLEQAISVRPYKVSDDYAFASGTVEYDSKGSALGLELQYPNSAVSMFGKKSPFTYIQVEEFSLAYVLKMYESLGVNSFTFPFTQFWVDYTGAHSPVPVKKADADAKYQQKREQALANVQPFFHLKMQIIGSEYQKLYKADPKASSLSITEQKKLIEEANLQRDTVGMQPVSMYFIDHYVHRMANAPLLKSEKIILDLIHKKTPHHLSDDYEHSEAIKEKVASFFPEQKAPVKQNRAQRRKMEKLAGKK